MHMYKHAHMQPNIYAVSVLAIIIYMHTFYYADYHAVIHYTFRIDYIV